MNIVAVRSPLFCFASIARLTLAGLAVSLLLSGCVSGKIWNWKVSRFHTLGDMQEKTFTIVPLRSEFNDSLEFMSYAKVLAMRLGNYGMRYQSQTELGKTDYLVCLDYGIGQPREKQYSYPLYGQTGGGIGTVNGTVRANNGQTASYNGTYTAPASFGVVGTVGGSMTVYDRYVRVYIYDGKFTKEIPLKKYEAVALSSGQTSALTEVVPAGIKAIMREFPGKDGSTKTEVFGGLD